MPNENREAKHLLPVASRDHAIEGEPVATGFGSEQVLETERYRLRKRASLIFPSTASIVSTTLAPRLSAFVRIT